MCFILIFFFLCKLMGKLEEVHGKQRCQRYIWPVTAEIARAKRLRQFEFVMWVIVLLCVVSVNVLFWSAW